MKTLIVQLLAVEAAAAILGCVLALLLVGCVQHSTNARISIPISINVSVVPPVEAGGVR